MTLCKVCKFRGATDVDHRCDECRSSFRSAVIPATGGPVTLRPELVNFACLMEAKLKKHDGDDPERYRNDNVDDLLTRLYEHVSKMNQRTKASCADVANFAMMVAHHFEE